MNILIIDDDRECCEALESFIKMIKGCVTYKTSSVINALSIIKSNDIDIIFSDVEMPDLTGLDLINLTKKNKRKAEIILISGKQDVISSINALELGIYDFLVKPVDIYTIEKIIHNISSYRKIEKDVTTILENINHYPDEKKIDISSINCDLINQQIEYGGIAIYSEPLKLIYNKLSKLINYDEYPVLIEGESGVGKEAAARYIHFNGHPNEKPFVAVNCAAIPTELFESELFGYSKGAFTGAKSEGNEGFIKSAKGGTLFLDEITEVPLELQAKLLRVIQEGEFYKVGGRTKESVECRLVFASNRNTEELVENGHFRKDLYYRISPFKVQIPPLRETINAIIPLIVNFINEQNNKHSKSVTHIEAGFLKRSILYPWPGNVRELQWFIKKIILFIENETISTDHFDLSIKPPDLQPINYCSIENFVLPETPFNLELFNQTIVELALDRFNGNKTRAAEFLGLTRMQMYKRFKIK